MIEVDKKAGKLLARIVKDTYPSLSAATLQLAIRTGAYSNCSTGGVD